LDFLAEFPLEFFATPLDFLAEFPLDFFMEVDRPLFWAAGGVAGGNVATGV
jgi:hypothetical protein